MLLAQVLRQYIPIPMAQEGLSETADTDHRRPAGTQGRSTAAAEGGERDVQEGAEGEDEGGGEKGKRAVWG